MVTVLFHIKHDRHKCDYLGFNTMGGLNFCLPYGIFYKNTKLFPKFISSETRYNHRWTSKTCLYPIL